MLRITQIERMWIKGPQQDAPIVGRAFEEYGVALLLVNQKGEVVAGPSLKEIKEPTWIIIGYESLEWEELESFLGRLTPEELKVLKVKVED